MFVMFIRTGSMIAAAFALGACMDIAPTTPTGQNQTLAQVQGNLPAPPIAGGYAPADERDPGYKEAEALAIETIYKRDPQRGLVEKKTAQVQVVAGLNYLFDITMTGGRHYTIRIYRDLQNNMTVSDYKKAD